MNKIKVANPVVEMDGVRRTAVVSFIKDPRIGDYVLLHAGFAIRKWSEQDVREYNEIMQVINQPDIPLPAVSNNESSS